MNGISKVFIREHKRVKRNKFISFILYVFPLIFCFALFFIFSKGAIRDLPICVLDLDNTSFSRKIARMIDATSSAKVAYKVTDFHEGRKLISEGRAYGLLYIPKNFYSDVQKTLKPKIVYYYNNQAILIGGIVSKDVSIAIQNAMVGGDVGVKMKKGLSKNAALMVTNLIRVDERLHANPYLNYSYFLSYIAFVHTFQIFITIMTIWAFGAELKYGSAGRLLRFADNSIINIALGKMSFYTVVFFIIIMTVFLSYDFIYGAPFEGNYLTFALSTLLFILAYEFMGVTIVAVLSNLRFALSFAAFYTSMGFTLAGMTYPSMAMPLIIQVYSSLLPIRPYIALVIDQTLRGIPTKYEIGYLLWLMCFIAVGCVALILLKMDYNNREKWYQI